MPAESAKPRPNIYETITAKIIAAIESNRSKSELGEPVLPWQRGGLTPVLPTNAATGNAYRGVNVLSLWVTALEHGNESGLYATYKQWSTLGAQVRKGESAAPIVFYRELEKAKDGADPADPDATETIRMARGYWVFAAEQVMPKACFQHDGFALPGALPPDPIDRIAAADAYVAATGARIVIGGARSCYRPSIDTIHMPDEARLFRHRWSFAIGGLLRHAGARARQLCRPPDYAGRVSASAGTGAVAVAHVGIILSMQFR